MSGPPIFTTMAPTVSPPNIVGGATFQSDKVMDYFTSWSLAYELVAVVVACLCQKSKIAPTLIMSACALAITVGLTGAFIISYTSQFQDTVPRKVLRSNAWAHALPAFIFTILAIQYTRKKESNWIWASALPLIMGAVYMIVPSSNGARGFGKVKSVYQSSFFWPVVGVIALVLCNYALSVSEKK